eukprot:s114_g13.t1
MSPTANDGIFLGYHIQPGFAWKGEYLVAKLEALDYHAENGSITEAKEPKPDRLEDNLIVEARPVPFESEMQPAEPDDEAVDKSSDAVLDALAPSDPGPEGGIIDDTTRTPKGEPIPDGYHWVGTRIVKTYRGSKRPPSIPSDFWSMLGPKERAELSAEEAAKASGSSGSGGASSSAAPKAKAKKKKQKKKKEEEERRRRRRRRRSHPRLREGFG